MKATKSGAIKLLQALDKDVMVDLHINIQEDGEGGFIKGASCARILNYMFCTNKSVLDSDEVRVDFSIIIQYNSFSQGKYYPKETKFNSKELAAATIRFYALKDRIGTEDVTCNVNFEHETISAITRNYLTRV